jgi:DNA-binding IclR family transcriptional regulator
MQASPPDACQECRQKSGRQNYARPLKLFVDKDDLCRYDRNNDNGQTDRKMVKRRRLISQRAAQRGQKSAASDNSRDTARTLERAARIIEVVAGAEAPMSIADIERATGLPKATAYRLTRQLVALDLLQIEPGTKRHVEGARFRAMSWNAMNSAVSRTVRRGIISGLACNLNETCYIGGLIDGEVGVIDSIASPRPLGVNIKDGARLPLHATAPGKLLLAQMSSRDRMAFLRAGPLSAVSAGTITQPARLEAELAEIARSGFATEDQEYAEGVISVSVPIRSGTGRTLGALAMSAPLLHLPLEAARREVPRLQAAAELLAGTFGGA